MTRRPLALLIFFYEVSDRNFLAFFPSKDKKLVYISCATVYSNSEVLPSDLH